MAERDFLILTSLVALGIVFISALVVIYQKAMVLPVLIMGIILFALVLYQGSEKSAHLAENLEMYAFFITFAVICISIILLYKPA